MKTIVFGYSSNPERYSYMASELLSQYGHEVVNINPREESGIEKLKMGCDTLTLYVSAQISDKYQERLLGLKPRRVIFNPGTENSDLQKKFETLGVDVVVGCTLVMLRTHQF